MSDEAKKAILARRAKFVAAAIAGLGAACGKHTSEDAGAPPGPCLSVAIVPDAGDEDVQPRPRVCLSVPMPRDAGKGGDAGKTCNCAPGDPLCACY